MIYAGMWHLKHLNESLLRLQSCCAYAPMSSRCPGRVPAFETSGFAKTNHMDVFVGVSLTKFVTRITCCQGSLIRNSSFRIKKRKKMQFPPPNFFDSWWNHILTNREKLWFSKKLKAWMLLLWKKIIDKHHIWRPLRHQICVTSISIIHTACMWCIDYIGSCGQVKRGNEMWCLKARLFTFSLHNIHKSLKWKLYLIDIFRLNQTIHSVWKNKFF